jgi:hypothetical protein
MTNVDALTCSNADCEVSKTGKCVEGLETSKCPHFGKLAAPPEPSDEDEIQKAIDTVPLPSGARLTISQVNPIRRAHFSRIIAIIGPYKCGKTSLIASLYDLFQRGSTTEGFSFVRSDTLHAFERACHHARAVSQRKVPETDRTPRGEVEFFHLGMAHNGAQIDLILGDRAGEEYLNAADNPTDNANFIETRRADTITLLVDGSSLLDDTKRHGVLTDSVMIIQALIDGGAVATNQRMALVLTKLDEVQASGKQTRALRDFDRIRDKLKELFGDCFLSLETFMVASSPITDVLPRGHNVTHLLAFWTAPVPPPPVRIYSEPAVREFDRLAESAE